jgi:UDP-GlcNAc:undecaprenyl-phosphate GlcNAc-1-phosphate transferase
LWIVGITNAFNFIDNLDGAAAGVTIIASMSLFVISFFGNQFLIALLALSLVGSGVGFLFWNFNPARIYLGDGGALFVGVVLSVLLLQVETQAQNLFASLAIPLLILALPILDTSVVVTNRIYRGTSIFQGGKDHLSHRLQNYGFSKKLSVLILWFLSALLSGIALLVNFADSASQIRIAVIGLMFTLCLYILFLFLPKVPKLS